MYAVITQSQYWNIIFPCLPLCFHTVNLINMRFQSALVKRIFQDDSKIQQSLASSLLTPPLYNTNNKKIIIIMQLCQETGSLCRSQKTKLVEVQNTVSSDLRFIFPNENSPDNSGSKTTETECAVVALQHYEFLWNLVMQQSINYLRFNL